MVSTYASSSPSLPHGGGSSAHRSAGHTSSTSSQPPGTFLPGTKVQVGDHRVVIERYLSEGGFAHVYVVRVPRDNNKYEVAVLKRVAVPDRDHLASMRTEVETMKKLKGHKHVVTYMDSHASQLKGGGYEVFLLMEFCSGGGLIDFMNTRLQHRLTEPEILKIFGDIAEGVATMHYLKPPLLHRDLKVENVLISKVGSGPPLYKVCDFGSAAVPRPAATTPEEGRLIEEDVQKHTTMQYRSPEMIDVWRKQPIDEKADIWALGVLLYKLCYYTTPFEDVGQMAILNASYKYPAYPTFSDRLKKFIATMLQEQPSKRPNIYQVLKEVCGMRGTEIPIKDIYAERTASEARSNQALPSPDAPVSPTPIGLQKASPVVTTVTIPDIAPMRRGRPTSVQPIPPSAKPPAASVKGDPFAALDSKNYEVRAGAVDELSKRFPSLDEFNIAQDRGTDFSFSKASTTTKPEPKKSDLSERVTNALADEVFGQTTTKSSRPLIISKPSTVNTQKPLPDPSPPKPKFKPQPRDMPPPTALLHQPTPVRASAGYRSTAVGTSPPARKTELPLVTSRPVWKVPDSAHRSSSQPQPSSEIESSPRYLQPNFPAAQRPALADLHRSKSQSSTTSVMGVASTRPSLEGHRPSVGDVNETVISRTKSAQNRSRPTSLYVESNLDYLKDQEASRKRPSMEGRQHSRQQSRQPSPERRSSNADDSHFTNDVEYLRSQEDGDVSKLKQHRKILGHHKKRSSLTNMLAGRFGDAFKRFEPGSSQDKYGNETALVTPDYRDDDDRQLGLSPILGSESTPTTLSPSRDSAFEEIDDLPADVRRELERSRLLEEEKRVANAAVEYRNRVTTQGTGGAPSAKALTIQARVQSLLEEGRQSPVPKRTAEGYGRFTATTEPVDGASVILSAALPVAPKPLPAEKSNNPFPRARAMPSNGVTETIAHSTSMPLTNNLESAIAPSRVPSRPNVPPKAAVLRTGGAARWTSSADALDKEGASSSPPPSTNAGARPSGLAALLAKDLEGVPDYPSR